MSVKKYFSKNMDQHKYEQLLIKALKNHDILLFRKAIEYKNKFIPNTLYKYYSLTNDYKLNKKKINCLSNNKIHMSNLMNFNDPFDGNYLYFSKKKFDEYKIDKKSVDNFINAFKDLLTISSFTSNGYQCMPMWAFYSNNHNGYCVEYKITEKQKNNIYKVEYAARRFHAEEIVLEYMRGLAKNDKILTTFCRLNYILSFCTKEFSWYYENEYREVLLGKNSFTLKPTNVYIGYNTSKQNVNKIIKSVIKKNPNIKIYLMKSDIKYKKFELKKELIYNRCRKQV